ncbi:DMT(drug/metabolite transporter) superfamily permease [Desulfosporosinus acidiphilus SJ4]|uniref:DMT(Drug/metabolite transporter) superfamily permease n=1 Tax=Desulfosporosinus acidiphilus (strain DSM 22704 / JCM 16185 / SJ4) TaxID=646529 RepID=I4D4F4_DESAJ|nr:DMT family transporter [Desulfosporosinus acidiphilus]AFM40678.1 DMT(drug/metabolite transporter) superfamily permease [Desulfosporosinus acidiphilus SJ4]
MKCDLSNEVTVRRRLPSVLYSEQFYANLAMLAVIIFWGISYVSIKITVVEIPPITMALIRFALASIILGIILRRVEPQARLDKSDLPKMFLGGVFGITIYFLFENYGVKLSSATNASLIVSVVPIITIMLDILFFHSKLSIMKIAGVFIAIGGSYLAVTANGKVDLNSGHFLGNILMLCAMLSWAFFTLVNKSLQKKYSGLFLTTYQTFFGTLCFIPLSLFEYKEWRPFSLTVLGNLLFLAVFCSVAGYVLYTYALKRLDVALTTIYLNLIPVVGVLSGYLILRESVLPIQLVGGGITLLAIVIINFELVAYQLRKQKQL